MPKKKKAQRSLLYESLFGKSDSKPRFNFEEFFLYTISLNTLVILLESVDSIYNEWSWLFWVFEFIFVSIFTFEYILRAWVIVEDEKYTHPVWGRLKYLKTPFAIIDLLAILPFFVGFFLPLTRRQIHVAQILRLVRMFKMGRYFKAWDAFTYVFQDKKSELKITLYTILILLTISSSVIYAFENPVQPQEFSSIPASMWWGIVTLTTVGYGDMVPITTGGKIFGAFIALLGVGLFALPAGILGSGFIDQVLAKNKKFEECPHCGKSLHKVRRFSFFR